MPITYTQACSLCAGLTKCHAFADRHSVPSADAAVELIQSAGLSAAYIPLAVTSRNAKSPKYEMHLAVVDPKPNNMLVLNTEKSQGVPTSVYSLTKLVPLTSYAADLVQMDLSRLWWAMPHFFWDITHVLADYRCDNSSGRSHWGDQDRAAFANAFEQQWTPERVVYPGTPVPMHKVRFSRIPTLAPAATGDD
jgi:hypothetical protein